MYSLIRVNVYSANMHCELGQNFFFLFFFSLFDFKTTVSKVFSGHNKLFQPQINLYNGFDCVKVHVLLVCHPSHRQCGVPFNTGLKGLKNS